MAAKLFLLSLVLAASFADASVTEVAANPVRKVVVLLQNMQKKVAAEGDKERQLFEKFMCYCKTGAGTLDQSIGDAENKIPQVQSSKNEAIAQKAQLETELAQAQTDRVDAKDAIGKATALREKEAAAFAKESGELKSNIAALQGAISAVSKGMSGGFLQTNTAAMVRNLAMNGPNIEDGDRQDLLAFLSGGQSAGYAPKSGEITGILKTMEDEMSKSLADAVSEEGSATASFDELVNAKSKQIQSLTKAIESKSKRVGDLGVEIAMMANDLDDTAEALAQDKKFLADLSKNCATKEDEWDEIQKMRAQETIAIAETIKILNDDDALELFKKTLPGASGFLQLDVSDKAVRKQALEIIRKEKALHPGATTSLGFVEMAIQGKAMGFEKVVKMIDNMVSVLKKEQLDDDSKKEYCTIQLDEVEDKKKGLDLSLKDLASAMADAEEGIATIASEIKALAQGIKALDKSVAEATEQRKEEHEDANELIASDSAAKQILGFAKNRLNKFYNPKLYKPAPKRNLEFASMSMGYSFAQVHSHNSEFDAPADAPAAPGPFKKKGEESNGVIAMIDLLVKDLDKEMTEAEVTEKESQREYEAMMADSKAKRAEDAKMITAKESSKAQLEGELESAKDEKASATKELMATLEYTSSLHKDCDWLLKNFEVRKEARASEVDALGKAKAVLSGADFSLLQQAKFLQRRA